MFRSFNCRRYIRCYLVVDGHCLPLAVRLILDVLMKSWFNFLPALGFK